MSTQDTPAGVQSTHNNTAKSKDSEVVKIPAKFADSHVAWATAAFYYVKADRFGCDVPTAIRSMLSYHKIIQPGSVEEDEIAKEQNLVSLVQEQYDALYSQT